VTERAANTLTHRAYSRRQTSEWSEWSGVGAKKKAEAKRRSIDEHSMRIIVDELINGVSQEAMSYG
jgi:hypothetical protein